MAIAYTLWVNVYPPQPGAYRVIPWIVLAWCCVPLDRDAALSSVARPGYLRLPGRGRPHEAGLTSQPRPATVRRALLMLLY